MSSRLTPKMKIWLRSLFTTGEPPEANGMSEHGGACTIAFALLRRNLIDQNWQLTDAGKKTAARLIEAELTGDARDVTIELFCEHCHQVYPHARMRASNLSGPVGNAQRRALHLLLRLGLVNRERGPHVNRYACWTWRLTECGFELAREILAAAAAERKQSKKA